MSGPPPPPPPHGGVPKGSGLPPGKYDIFVIPEHSSGGGFLYLPSMQPNVNSFAAGFASALILVVLGQTLAPAFRTWWEGFHGLGNMAMAMLVVGVGFGAWALGRFQNQDKGFPGSGGGFSGPGNSGRDSQGGWTEKSEREKQKGSWEKAREEMRKKEEERKIREAEQKRREEAAKRLAELRAKDAKERQEREKERQRKEQEARDKKERLEAEQRAKELAIKLEEERKERERLEKEAKEAHRQRMSYAYSGVGEKISMWPNGRPPAAPKSTTSSASKPPPSAASSQRKPGPAPSAAKSNVSGVSTENSYRPYDKPKQQPKRRGSVSSLGSESSWAASQTTGRTTPPPSTRAGPYSTKDPDKIVISGVYLFMNQFSKTPASQLISGVGTVTDGLILRVTTEGLFIDDDVRNVPQREWDVKTWTLKQVEVWCPPHCLKSPAASSPAPGTKPNPLLYKMASSRARDRGATQPLVGEEADVYLTEMLRACKTCCRLGLCNRTFRDTNITSSTGQTGEWKSKGLHLLRATNREGKRYLFVIDESESWKVSTGLQRLRKSPLAQQLAVSGMAASDARGTLEMLGWA
ncbi:hypothetical protein RAB80_005207 [Fusarium oxysporum f. sp. vasinfectum]|nr:hypothetical protein RAB80_005207 [Fusarium oxysporum f. sp. vasinfectum]